MVYRRLVAEDAAAWWAVRLEALEREPLAFGMSPEEHRVSTIDAARERIVEEGNFALGAFDGADLVGIARFVRERSAKERHKGHVYGVYLRASHRGRGVAREMMAALIGEAREEAGLEHLLLSAAVHNTAARALYQAMGFVGYGIEPRALKVGDEYIGEEHMILRLR